MSPNTDDIKSELIEQEEYAKLDVRYDHIHRRLSAMCAELKLNFQSDLSHELLKKCSLFDGKNVVDSKCLPFVASKTTTTTTNGNVSPKTEIKLEVEPDPTEDNLDEIMEGKYVPDIGDDCEIGTSNSQDVRIVSGQYYCRVIFVHS